MIVQEKIHRMTADSVNAKYDSQKDDLVSVKDRFEKFIDNDSDLKEFLETIFQEFRLRFPQFNTFTDMYPEMVDIRKDKIITMGDLVINDGMQRKPDVNWIVDICGKFDPFNVNSVRVYPTNNAYAVWDGQHTTLVLMCVAVYGFSMTISEALDLVLPVAVYPAGNNARLRDRFIKTNDGTMAKKLDDVDLYEQYVYAVRHDGSTDPWHVRFGEIQSHMETFGAFFTHEKFSNSEQPGALSRPTEIYPKSKDPNKWPINVIASVLEYHSITNPHLPFEPLEMDNMCHIFRQCGIQGIKVDSDYIRKFAQALEKVTQNTWKKGYKGKNCLKHAKVSKAYQNYLDRLKPAERSHYGERCNQTEVAPAWLCQVVANQGFDYDLPEFSGRFDYMFPNKDLV